MSKAKDELVGTGDIFFFVKLSSPLTINSSFQSVSVEPVLIQYCLHFAILNLVQLYNLMLSFFNYILLKKRKQ